MILIYGGSYQGKLDFAKETFKNFEHFNCDDYIDFNYTILNSFEKYIYYLVKNNISATDFVNKNIERLMDKVIIMTDISCGIVPVSSELRKWREESSRCSGIISRHSDEVYRVVCGISLKIK